MKGIRLREKGRLERDYETAFVSAIPLEREVAIMKKERMPIKGGATPFYSEEGVEIDPAFDFRVDVMDRARREISNVIRERAVNDKAPEPVVVESGESKKE